MARDRCAGSTGGDGPCGVVGEHFLFERRRGGGPGEPVAVVRDGGSKAQRNDHLRFRQEVGDHPGVSADTETIRLASPEWRESFPIRATPQEKTRRAGIFGLLNGAGKRVGAGLGTGDAFVQRRPYVSLKWHVDDLRVVGNVRGRDLRSHPTV
ncbi:hypothetical protein D3C85_1068830 [compost metagenome]